MLFFRCFTMNGGKPIGSWFSDGSIARLPGTSQPAPGSQPPRGAGLIETNPWGAANGGAHPNGRRRWAARQVSIQSLRVARFWHIRSKEPERCGFKPRSKG